MFQTPKLRTRSLGLTTIFLNSRYVSTAAKSESTPSEKAVLYSYAKVPNVGTSRTFARSHDISTLDPARLIPSDFIDLKQQFHFAVRYRNISVMFATYKRIVSTIAKGTKYGCPLNFPAGTHGYFYLHHPPTDAHPCAATLRFRICDKHLPPQKAFSSGKDLLLPKGAPWEMDLLHLFTSAYVTNFREALLLDNMISEEALSQLNGLVAAHRIRDRLPFRPVFSFRQPFSVSMGQHRTDNTRSCIMCLEYDPSTWLRMAIRVLHIPEEFRGETYVNMGDILPLKKARGKLTGSMADVLLRQSPSVPSRADQTRHST
ncbi:hypothetical protein BDP27DRAFT_1334419 [Rhodocollybia butyracea]|uniref:Uncharacterized protein n=1 Tax=Rhodocollybia butyracea TaxID=206335 RepID=A0A9P5U2T9_9AGAR|nr:hypothetical protein BDP27DRAFT_1334419 [Rhodocollybia butyracea]